MNTASSTHFDQQYQRHLKHLKLKGLQPKTIDAYARAIRRIGARFDGQIDDLCEAQLTDYFTELMDSHSWSALKLDLYGLKFYYEHVLHQAWVAPGQVKPPKVQRLPDIVTVEEVKHRFSRNDRQLQGTPGAIAVLHTNTRRLDYHPPVHLLMPAAAIDAQRKLWRTKRRGRAKGHYLFNHKALAKVFRAKMLAGIEAAGLALPPRHPGAWVVDCKSVGSGAKALVYLGRYLYRGVIREQDILSCDNGQVRFRYREAKTGQMQYRTLSGAHFLWLVLQHVLPKGFRRARNFGFLHPNRKRLIALLHVLLRYPPPPPATASPRPAMRCPRCDHSMLVVRTRLRPACAPPARRIGQRAHRVSDPPQLRSPGRRRPQAEAPLCASVTPDMLTNAANRRPAH